MAKGIKVIWPYEGGTIAEIEYFCGIDVDDLASISDFTKVPTEWPSDETYVEYQVDARCEHQSDGNVNLIVNYDPEHNLELDDRYDIQWGENTIYLTKGDRAGSCSWSEEVRWEAFDLNDVRGRPQVTYIGSRRSHRFRNLILSCDDHECVITGEKTPEALDAAHLVPAKNGENDMPINGITLRADLHRLFDADLFTFNADGKLVVTDKHSNLSDKYRRLFEEKRLPPRTFDRVRPTLALLQFRGR